MGLKVRGKYYIRTWNMGLNVRRKSLYKNMGLIVRGPKYYIRTWV